MTDFSLYRQTGSCPLPASSPTLRISFDLRFPGCGKCVGWGADPAGAKLETSNNACIGEGFSRANFHELTCTPELTKVLLPNELPGKSAAGKEPKPRSGFPTFMPRT